MAINEIERFWKVNKADDKIVSNAQLTLDQTMQNKHIVGCSAARKKTTIKSINFLIGLIGETEPMIHNYLKYFSIIDRTVIPL